MAIEKEVNSAFQHEVSFCITSGTIFYEDEMSPLHLGLFSTIL
jgi:hypothetical protein